MEAGPKSGSGLGLPLQVMPREVRNTKRTTGSHSQAHMDYSGAGGAHARTQDSPGRGDNSTRRRHHCGRSRPISCLERVGPSPLAAAAPPDPPTWSFRLLPPLGTPGVLPQFGRRLAVTSALNGQAFSFPPGRGYSFCFCFAVSATLLQGDWLGRDLAPGHEFLRPPFANRGNPEFVAGCSRPSWPWILPPPPDPHSL